MTLMLPTKANINMVHPAPSANVKLNGGGRKRIEPATKDAVNVAMPGQNPPARALQSSAMLYTVNGDVVESACWNANLTKVPATTRASAEPYILTGFFRNRR